MKLTSPSKGILFAIITATLWGFLPIGLQVIGKEVSAYTIVWFRFFVAFTLLFTYIVLTDRKALIIFIKPPFLLLVAAVALAGNYLGFMEGINRTDAGSAQVIMQIGPLLLVLYGVFFLKERISRIQIIGFIIVVIGMLLFYSEQLSHLEVGGTYITGMLCLLTATCFWAVYAILQKKLVNTHNTQTLNMFVYFIPFLIYTPFVHFQLFDHLAHWKWILLAALGLNTLVAYGCLSLALKYTQAYKVSVILALNPIITLISLAVLQHLQVNWIEIKTLSWITLVGAAIVFIGAVMAIVAGNTKGEAAADQ